MHEIHFCESLSHVFLSVSDNFVSSEGSILSFILPEVKSIFCIYPFYNFIISNSFIICVYFFIVLKGFLVELSNFSLTIL